jgi:DNA-binding transcriptional regulator GbsR (MarR family)
VLRDLLMLEPVNDDERYARARLSEMHGLIEQVTNWYDDVKKLDTGRLASLLSLGSKVTRFLDARDRIISIGRGRRKVDN